MQYKYEERMREKREIVAALRRPKKETKWLVRIQQ